MGILSDENAMCDEHLNTFRLIGTLMELNCVGGKRFY